MRTFLFLFLGWSAVVRAGEADLIDLGKLDFSIHQDLRYASRNNPAGHAFLPEAKCVLRRKVAESLSRVASSLKLQNLGLKAFDCYRPLTVQAKIWDGILDKSLVDDPREGGAHSRGAAVDVTLVDAMGAPLEMPSAYGMVAAPNSRRGAKGLRILRREMAREGFQSSPTSWWHFTFRGADLMSLEDIPVYAIK